MTEHDHQTRLRRTKIVATLGPSTNDDSVLLRLIEAGVNVVRLNFSHGKIDAHLKRAKTVRELAAQLKRPVAIMGDLQGPKIRIAGFTSGKITLTPGDAFILDTQLGAGDGVQDRVGLDYPELVKDIHSGDILLLDDGRLSLQVDSKTDHEILCTVINGGELSNNKGINRQGGGLSAPALTDKDRADIKAAATADIDYLAVSFPRSVADIETARALIQQTGSQAGIIAKIERSEVALDPNELDAIIMASDGVMVARGDLGVEIGDAQLIGVQKYIIARSRQLNRPVITATQMMESMTHSPIPTRAEVFDVANAVIDGTDAVMLSAETATGHYPVETVQAVDRVCLGAERHPSTYTSRYRLDKHFNQAFETIAMSAMYAANHLHGVRAIVSITDTGHTPLWMSRLSSGKPIFALSANPRTLAKTALFRGVFGLYFQRDGIADEDLGDAVVEFLKQQNRIISDDFIIMTYQASDGRHSSSNNMQVVKVK